MQYSSCQIAGMKLNYIKVWKGTPVLFLHGGGVCASTYKKNIELLAKKYQVIAPDIPCFGESSVPNKIWGFEEFASLFSDFIDALWLQDIVLIGHSFGGGIALHLAAKCKKISRLVLIDSAGIAPRYPAWKLPLWLISKTFRNLVFYKDTSMSWVIVRDFLGNIWQHLFSLWLILKIMKKTLFTSTAVFDKITQPTRILWWDTDEIFSPSITQDMQKNIKGSTLTYVHGNHDWCLFMPETFMKLVAN